MPTTQPAIVQITTTPFQDQRPGTSGLRKKTSVFRQPHYLENFIQAALNALQDNSDMDFSKETVVVGGDGRYHNQTAIRSIVGILAANGVNRVLVARQGILSTPAMSAVIRNQQALGGFVLSASHNPGGDDADFGIKYNIRNGGPAPEILTEQIYRHTLILSHYHSYLDCHFDLETEECFFLGSTEVVIFDPLAEYTALMKEVFDFPALRALFLSGFRLCFDAMHGVTGPYAHHIFEQCLGASTGTVIRGEPLEDFGGGHPDPNLVHAKELVTLMSADNAPDLGAASDGDGDRNLILGKEDFISPGDSLAVITEYAQSSIPRYHDGLAGVARSMPTSMAVDRVAEALGIPHFETPTGWKFFGNLMDANLCTLCGEESFGTGSNHIREKDGLWAILCWLSILSNTKQPVSAILHKHWKKFGRSYFQRHDYEEVNAEKADEMVRHFQQQMEGLAGTTVAGSVIKQADDFSYTDPVDGSTSQHQGFRIILSDGSRIIWRLSGTGTDGATLRIYLERYLEKDITLETKDVIEPLARAAQELLQIPQQLGRNAPTVIT